MRPTAPQPFGLKPYELAHVALHQPSPTSTCRHCSRPYSAHTDKPGRMVPRVECLGMRGRFEVTS